MLSWVARWARPALVRADYFELGATYQAGRPYAAIVPTAVIRNAGVPLGLVLTPTERAASYELFWDDMGLSPEEKCDLVFSKPLLSEGARHYVPMVAVTFAILHACDMFSNGSVRARMSRCWRDA
jgi:hypothetical protein